MQVERVASHTSVMIARTLLAAVPLCLFPLGCSSLNTVTTVHQNAKGSVALEEVTDWSFEASHPTMVDSATIAKALRGVQRDDTQPVSAKMSVGGGKPMRVFSDEDVEFLAPLLAQALSHAKPEQIVGFRLSSSAGSGSEPTTGTLYAQRASLYLTLTQYQGKPAKSGSSWFGRQSTDSTSTKVVSFIPSTAGRVETASPSVAQGQSNASTIVIDYQALAKAGGVIHVSAKAMPSQQGTVPVATPIGMTEQPTAYPASSQGQDPQETESLNQKLEDLRQAKEAITKKDAEINVLRKETEWMKRELKERTAEIKELKTKKVSTKAAPKKKAATAEAIIK